MLIVCPSLLAELEPVLPRAKFRPYVTTPEIRAYVALVRRLSSVKPDPDVAHRLTPDPGDDYLVALACVAAADFLVSGDPHLTELKQANPPVLTPKAFLRQIASEFLLAGRHFSRSNLK